jgi:hypothetical protein
MTNITPLPSTMAVFVGGPKHGLTISDPKTSVFYVPKPIEQSLFVGPLPDRPPRTTVGTYERKYNEDTGVPGYIWAGWEDEK